LSLVVYSGPAWHPFSYPCLPAGLAPVTAHGPDGDPGNCGLTPTNFCTDGDLEENSLDVEWSGAAATGAKIELVASASTETSEGIDLSALYIVDHNLAPVMSTSYGSCEQTMGAVGTAFYNSLWKQAAAQGIVLLPVTPNYGGNLTTNLIQTLDNRAGEIHNALSANEDAARRAGLAWPLPDDLGDEVLELRLYPASAAMAEIKARRPQPAWPAIHRELRRKGVTLHVTARWRSARGPTRQSPRS